MKGRSPDDSGSRHEARVEAAIASDQAAVSALVASWRRSSSLHRLDPGEARPPHRLSDSELELARERLGSIVHAAQPSMDRLFQAVGGIGCCVLLADRDGIPVDRRGAVADDATFEEWGLWPGTVWSEGSEGTNGIGTCLVEGRTLTIHRDEHFLSRNGLMSCTTAPIHDHEGNLAGALDVSSCRADLTEGFVGLITLAVNDAARRIEAENFRLAFGDHRILVVAGGEPGMGGMLAVDPDDIVVGASRAARQILGLTPAHIARQLPVADLLDGDGGEEGFGRAERGVLQRALARAGGNASAAARLLGISRATLYRKLRRLGLEH